MSKAKRKSNKPYVAEIWFIGGPFDNRVMRMPWTAKLEARGVKKFGSGTITLGGHLLGAGEIQAEMVSFYRLEKLATCPAVGSPRSLKSPIDVSFFEELEYPAEFYCYVHESVTHAQLIERIYLTGHQPECEFQIDRDELDLKILAAVGRLGNPQPVKAKAKR